jgi:nicotinamide-nucleotide amidase
MARGALECSRANIVVSISGIAGPEPDERGNPVGLVYLPCTRKAGNALGGKCEYGGIGRSPVRYAAASEALAPLTRMARVLT